MLAKTLRVLFFICFGFCAFGQNDTIVNGDKLKEVVVTGQYNPQSVKKAVYQVKVISRQDIDRQAGNNLADLLNQTLNITVMPNASTGKSGVSLFGLDSRYFKILVDNIPLVNDEGLGDRADLTQINLDDVQQIEIVEGAMGVEYGANAISGIINIITKKGSRSKWEITPFIQEETIGKEYNGIDKGRHIQSIRIAHNISDKWHANATFTANDFDGFLDGQKGRDWLENDGLRGYQWLPKRQLHAKAYLGFSPNTNHRFFYRFEYFDEETKRFASVVDPNFNPATETTDPIASDDIFSSERFFHLLNASGKFNSGLTYDVSASYQQQKRNVEQFQYRIRSGEKFDIENFEYESRKVFYSRGSLSNFLDSKYIDFQLGYEVNNIKGFASAVTGMFDGNNVERDLGNYDVYASTEINVTPKFSVRPGARAMFSSKFDTQTALSVSARYDLGKGYELRGIVGTCPRLPDFEELYTYFVDVNHDVRGNPNLTPEQGYSAFLHLNKNFVSSDKLNFDTKFSGWYIDVRDRIELIIINSTPLQYQFGNIDQYRTFGTSLTSSMTYGNLMASGGITLNGVSKILDSSTNQNEDFLYSLQMNGNLGYNVPKWKTLFSAYIKYNGPQYLFVQRQDDAGNTILQRGKQNDFAMLDATVRKSFVNNNLEITLGARNLTNLTTINTTATEGGAHDAPATSLLLGYGRSYFLKILYKFNFG
ncbi:TonB-dependent receptor plug domain-containing protein [Flavobacterium sp.]|uniref:TonB-dependent receptor plug domain-containing protein n=1 Tax=Flavobacterium sp. TaxID=239 RepID=UPI0012126B52|nr:TonB-dependent receptor plug domain-containing protein [Flavobacterium sp.]RZJ70818.1 MAG: TonB-dependent receptor [Flavobacterium sp.]